MSAAAPSGDAEGGTVIGARKLLLQFLAGQLERTPGWDRRVEHALVVAAGGADLERGRRLLAMLALAEQERRDASRT